ncbi:MAG: beta-phosphoglucomutase [Lachnospiraceae bacterium]|nr:beta-phosphoglucomutase [Lachnospiraceae bacterium]
MIDSFIFDLDGVLVFTDKYHYAAWKEMADDLGVYFDEKINNRLRGVSRMESLEIILERYDGPALSKEEKEALATKKNNIYRELLKKMTPEDVSDDVRFTLRELRNRGMHLAVGSSSKNAKLILEKVGLMEAFDEISDGDNISRSKPDPEVFIKAALFLDKKPEACMVVEDAFSGIEAAKAAGMKAIAIGDAKNSELADYRIDKLSDILNLIAV